MIQIRNGIFQRSSIIRSYIINEIDAATDVVVDERATETLAELETLFERDGACVDDAVFQVRNFAPHLGEDGSGRQEISRCAGLVADGFAIYSPPAEPGD